MGLSIKSKCQRGTKGTCGLAAMDGRGSETGRSSAQNRSWPGSIRTQGEFSLSRCSFSRPSWIWRQRGHGCRPSNVLTNAVDRELSREYWASIRIQAKD